MSISKRLFFMFFMTNWILTISLCFQINALGNTTTSPAPQVIEVNPHQQRDLTLRAFINTPGARLFQDKQYQEALVEFQILKLLYPSNVTIQRYIGLCQFQIGQFDAAAKSLQKAVEMNPENLASRFYFAEALAFASKFEKAGSEYAQIISSGEQNRYVEASVKRLASLTDPTQTSLQSLDELIAEEPAKGWTLSTTFGYQFDSNATLNSRDSELNSTSDQNAGSFEWSTYGSVDLFQTETVSIALDGNYSQNLYDDGLNELNTFTYGTGVTFAKFMEIAEKPVIIQLREGISQTLLDRQAFVYSDSHTLTFFTEPATNVQTTVIYSFSHLQFDDDSETPTVFSRDGFSHNIVWLQTFLLNEAQNLYVTLGYNYLHDDTEGQNFVRDVHGGQFTFHAPIYFISPNTEVELSTVYYHDDRPSYIADTEKGTRRSDTWELSASVEKKFSNRFLLRAYITYERAFAQNNIFEYRRTYGGTSVTIEF